MSNCELCGEPMPPGEEMFKYHGYSGACPKPPLPKRLSDDQKCWALHVVGPDDLMPAPSKAVAQFAADVMQRWFDGREEKHEYDPLMRWEVVEWPHGYEQWKAGSEQFAAEWANWAKKNGRVLPT